METVLTQEVKRNPAAEKRIKLLQQMMVIRRFEERCSELYMQEKVRGFLHLYIGQEAVAVGIVQALSNNDYIVSNYREHGHAIARGLDINRLMAEMYGKQEGVSHGRGGSMHLFDVSKNFYGGNSVVGGQLPLALGMALACKKLKNGRLTCSFFGDGAVVEGEFHEVMNAASLWQLPLLFVCENNYYAMGTMLKYSHAVLELEKKGAAYNIPSTAVDGMDVEAVAAAADKAVNEIRSTGRPYFIVCNTYRFRSHSMFDPGLYRDKNEIEEWKKKDPIILFQQKLIEEQVVDEKRISEIADDVEIEINEAIRYAEAGTWEAVGDLEKHLYYD